ncbi:MAG: ATP-binding protein, partial [Anaerolineae bacterium]|nr:ATP-binding protein [Anaerolineae bacterium]
MEANLYERRPGQTLAYLPVPAVDTLAETLVALANADGGTVVLGVDEDGRASE